MTVNDEMSIECPLDDTLKSGINKLSFDSKKGEMILDDILLFSFEENKKISTLLFILNYYWMMILRRSVLSKDGKNYPMMIVAGRR